MIALDSNILVYAESPDDREGRYENAIGLIAAASSIDTCIPLQVIGEFLNVCRRKKMLGMSAAVSRTQSYSELFYTPPAIFIDMEQAAQFSQAYDLQFFDALIVAVAVRAGATVLLSEDMHDGLVIDGLTIVDPFAPANEALLTARFGSEA